MHNLNVPTKLSADGSESSEVAHHFPRFTWKSPMILDADALDAAQTYKILIATVVPRSIAWISTLSKEGIANLAPFSFFTVACRKPPILVNFNSAQVGRGHPEGHLRQY